MKQGDAIQREDVIFEDPPGNRDNPAAECLLALKREHAAGPAGHQTLGARRTRACAA